MSTTRYRTSAAQEATKEYAKLAQSNGMSLTQLAHMLLMCC